MSLRPTYLDYYPYPAIQTTIVPALSYPFSTSPIPDVYTKINKREFDVLSAVYAPAIATRTSYQNLLLYSNDFTNGVWAATRSSVPAATVYSPDGVLAWKFMEAVSAPDTHMLRQAVSYGSAVYTRYVLAKAFARSRLELAFIGSVTQGRGFDLSTGLTFANTLGVPNAGSYGMVDAGDGWWLCWLTSSATTLTAIDYYLNNGSGAVYSGDGTSALFIAYDHLLGLGARGPIFATTGTARSVSVPAVDGVANPYPSDVFAYLVEETDPVNQTATVSKIVRTYARIPTEQVVPASLIISKPSLSGSFPQAFGAFRVFQPDTTLQEFDAYTAQTITSDSGVPSFYPTGGTYTLTFAGDTTASINYNDASATVQTRLNALTSVTNRGGLTVAGTYNSAGGFAVIFNAYAAATWTSSLTPTPFAVNPTQLTNNGYTQFVNGYQYTPTPITGGTFTVTIFGQTTAAINWNATTTQVAAALNLLSEVANRGNVTVTFPYGTMAATTTTAGVYYFGFLMVFGNAAITGTSSLTPAGSGLSVVIVDPPYGRTQTLTFSCGISLRTFTVPSHGILSTDTIYLKNSTTYYPGISGNITILDANTIQLAVSASASYASAAAMIELGKRTKANYQPGAATIRANKVTDFYLPGVSVGITTAADIPIPVNQSDNASFLQAVFAGTGTLNWQVGDLQQWIGPILSLQKTTINAADA